jgi:hypothetical protein
VTAEKSAAEVWNEAVAAAATALEEAVDYQWNGTPRRPNNYRSAARHVATIPNPYADTGIPARESEEWKALVAAAEDMGRSVAAFQNAKDAYTALYPKDRQ